MKGKFLIKGKRLNKLEAVFAQEAAATDEDVTEEDESGDEDEDEQKAKVRARLRDDLFSLRSSLPSTAQVLFPVSPDFLSPCRRRRS